MPDAEKKKLLHVETRGENLGSAVLQRARKNVAVTRPPLFDFATHTTGTFSEEWAVLSASAGLACILLEALVHIFLDTAFEVPSEGNDPTASYPRGAMAGGYRRC